MSLSFAAPAFFWALPLALLPVLVHFRARARERIVDFPGAYFLSDPVMPSTARRRRLEDILLLALRCGALLAAICALAGPRLPAQAFASPEGWGRVPSAEALVVVIDDSPSLGMRRNSEGEGWLKHELSALASVLRHDEGRSIALETTSGRRAPFAPPEAFKTAALELIDAPSPVSGSRAEALGRAMRRLADRSEDRKAVLLLTDGRKNHAEGATTVEVAEHWQPVWQALAADGAPALLVWKAADPPPKQWSISTLELVGAGEPVAGGRFALRVGVTCHRGSGRRGVVVRRARVAEDARGVPHRDAPEMLLERMLVLGEGEEETWTVPVLAERAGDVWFEARLEGADAWGFDDARTAVTAVRLRRAVWLVDARTERERPSRPGTDAAWRSLHAALNPFPGAEAARTEVRTQYAPAPEAWGAEDVAVVLHGPAGLNLEAGVAERLAGVLRGGAVIFFVPDLSGDPARWPPLRGILPHEATVLPRPVEGAESAESAEVAWHIGVSAPIHALLAPFENGRNGDLSSRGLARRVRMQMEAAAERPSVSAARFEDGYPALALQRAGRGLAVQLGFGPQGGVREGGIETSAAWPVFWSHAIEWAAAQARGMESTDLDEGGAASRALLAGAARTTAWPLRPVAAPRTWKLDGPWFREEPGDDAPAPRTWSLFVPSGADRALLPSPQLPGIYRLGMDRAGLEGSDAAANDHDWVGVRIAPEESSLASWPVEVARALDTAAARSGGAVIQELKALPGALEALRPGRSLSPWVWLVFFAVLAVEGAVLVGRGRAG